MCVIGKQDETDPVCKQAFCLRSHVGVACAKISTERATCASNILVYAFVGTNARLYWAGCSFLVLRNEKQMSHFLIIV